MDNSCDIVYDCRWSTEVNAKFVTDYICVEREVFGDYTYENFDRKFLQNIYGSSVICVVYIDGVPSAARALWRNDIVDRESYQPSETCVLSQCRGKGVFSEMTRIAISMLPCDALIYNFPNHNSFPGYLKLGWASIREYRMVLFTSLSEYRELHPIKMDSRYAEWWLKNNINIQYIKRFGTYFLVRKYPRPLSWKVISEVDKDVAEKFKKLSYPALIFYSGLKKTLYNSRFATLHVVAKFEETATPTIPIWKIDVI